MDMVEEVERGPAKKFSAETRRFAELVRAVDDEWKDASGLMRGGDPDAVTPQDLRNHLIKRARAPWLAYSDLDDFGEGLRRRLISPHFSSCKNRPQLS